MERYEAKSIGDLLRQAIEENQDAFRYHEISAVNAWPKIVGYAISRQTQKPFIKKGVMTIKVPGAPLRHELNMMRSTLAKAINAEVGRDVVKEIRFVG